MANFFGIVLSWLLRWISNAMEEWYQLELRDRRNRKIVTEAVKEAVNEARYQNEEIANNPEPVGASIDRLREFARKRSLVVDSKTNRTLFERGLDAARERKTAGIDSTGSTEISTSIGTSAGQD